MPITSSIQQIRPFVISGFTGQAEDDLRFLFVEQNAVLDGIIGVVFGHG